MAAYKDEERGTWYVSFYYEDWTGAKKRKVKRGFRTKKEALNFEAEYKRTAKADMDMTMGEFVEVYFRDKAQSLLWICYAVEARFRGIRYKSLSAPDTRPENRL